MMPNVRGSLSDLAIVIQTMIAMPFLLHAEEAGSSHVLLSMSGAERCCLCRSTVRRSTRLHSHTTAQPVLESQEEVNSLKPGRRSGRQR